MELISPTVPQPCPLLPVKSKAQNQQNGLMTKSCKYFLKLIYNSEIVGRGKC